VSGRALDLIPKPPASASANVHAPPVFDLGKLDEIVGHKGEAAGPVLQIHFGPRRPQSQRARGHHINARMGLNSWATGNDADAPLPDKHQN